MAKYSFSSKLTEQVCDKIGAIFNIHFVTTMQKKGKIYVNGTIGKPNEWVWLQNQCRIHGYIFTGRIIH